MDASRKEQFLSQIVENTGDAIIGFDHQGNINFWNKGAQELFGYRRLEIEGRPFKILVPEDLEGEFDEIFERLKDGEVIKGMETERVAKDGSRLYVSTTLSPILDGWRIIGYSAIIRDISETRELRAMLAKARQLQQTLFLTDKLASLSALAKGIAHEVNNPLTAIMTYTQLLLEDLGKVEKDPQRMERSLRKIEEDVKRCKSTLRLFLDTAETPDDITNISLVDLMKKVLAFQEQRLVNQGIQVEEEVTDVKIEGSEIRLFLVFNGILSNAIEAMPEGGSLRYTIKEEDERAIITIRDTGKGIPPEDINRIFDPFFTTKELGQGSGVSLYFCYDTIKRMGGNIMVESKVGEGSTFIIQLPRKG